MSCLVSVPFISHTLRYSLLAPKLGKKRAQQGKSSKRRSSFCSVCNETNRSQTAKSPIHTHEETKEGKTEHENCMIIPQDRLFQYDEMSILPEYIKPIQ